VSITGIQYHLATGKTSKNRGKFYKCPNKKPMIQLMDASYIQHKETLKGKRESLILDGT
jgi:hypothetical protein